MREGYSHMVFPKKSIVIDIGNENIKIIDLTRMKDAVKVNAFAMLNTPQNTINDGLILDKKALAETIKKAIDQYEMKAKDVVFTITSTKIITREVEFPNLKPKKLKPIVEMNASDYFPVDLSEYILDYTIQETLVTEEGKKVKVNMIACLSSLGDGYVDLAKELDLRIAGIDYSGNSIIHFAKIEKLKGSYILLDLGSESTMVSIMKNSVNKFNRELMTGTGIIIDHIKNHFEVSYEEALAISAKSLVLKEVEEEDNNPYLGSDILGDMEQILSGVSRIIDYYTSRNKEVFDKIYLVGGGAHLNGIEHYIERYFNIPTEKLERFQSVKTKSDQFSDVEMYFANTIGAIFSDINLVPRFVTAQIEKHTKKRTSLLFILLIIVALGALSLTQYRSISSLTLKKQQLEREIEDGKAVLELKKEYEELKSRADFRERILEVSASTSEQFSLVLDTMEKNNA